MKRFLLAGSRPNPVYSNNRFFSRFIGVFLLIGLIQNLAFSQVAEEQQVAFKKVLTKRSAKIINTLSITDSIKYQQVLATVVGQYLQLNTIHDAHKSAADILKKSDQSKEERETGLKKLEVEKNDRLLQLHAAFLSHLKEALSDDQVEKIKDGMTYRILPVTWSAYQDMLPHLTEAQKQQLRVWLVEAREKAMDEGSSEKKHEVFGKYKGRINNYLSAAGYDMKKEGEEWQKRIKEREAIKKESHTD